jgi:ribose transport system ATP-binding protein
MHADARRLLDGLGLDVDTRTPAHELGVAQQQVVEIAKALSQNARILVMDEPTAALSDREIARLFERIHALKRNGVAIIYVSHRLQEIFEIGDRITVLRDGKNVASLTPAETSVGDVVRLMVGRQVTTTWRERFCDTPGDMVLEVRDLHAESGVRAAAVDVRAGEIVGLAGLVSTDRPMGACRAPTAWACGCGVGLVEDQSAGDAVRQPVRPCSENRKIKDLALMRSQDNAPGRLANAVSRLSCRESRAPCRR